MITLCLEPPSQQACAFATNPQQGINKCLAPKSPDLPGHNQLSPKVIQHEDNQFSLKIFKNANKTMSDSLHLSSYNASAINKQNWLLKMAHPTIGTLHLFFMRYATDLNDIGVVG